MRRKSLYILTLVIYFGAFAWLILDPRLTTYLAGIIAANFFMGTLAYVVLMVIATVVAPLSFLPLIAVAAAIFGPFLTGILNVIGWWVGCLLAFYIARYAAKPILEKFIALDAIKKYENKIPKQNEFWAIVLLRALVPVDILSYALGILTMLQWRPHALATLIGIVPFAFIYAYGGSAIFARNVWQISLIVTLGIVVFLIRSEEQTSELQSQFHLLCR